MCVCVCFVCLSVLIKVERRNALWFLDVSHRFAKFHILNGETPSLSFSVIVWSFICTSQQSRSPKQRKQYVKSTTQRVSNLTFRQRWRSQLQMKMKKTFHDFILRQGTTYSFKVISYIVLNTTSSG